MTKAICKNSPNPNQLMNQRLIAHLISKEAHDVETKSKLGKSLLKGGLTDQFLEQVRGAVRNPWSGRFEEEDGAKGAFYQHLEAYLKDPTDSSFVSFSKSCTNRLVGLMEKQPLATGGYLAFAEYQHNEVIYLVIILMSTQEGLAFDSKLRLVSNPVLDYAKVRHAVRIRQSEVAENCEGVLHFISHGPEKVSDYFRSFLGCEKVISPRAQAALLHTALRAWGTHKGFNGDETDALMAGAHSYWKKCWDGGVPMMLSGLANSLQPDDPKEMEEFLGGEERNLAGTFDPPTAAAMKRFIKFSYHEKGFRLEVDRTLWLNRLEVSGGSLILHDVSPKLIESLREEQSA